MNFLNDFFDLVDPEYGHYQSKNFDYKLALEDNEITLFISNDFKYVIDLNILSVVRYHRPDNTWVYDRNYSKVVFENEDELYKELLQKMYHEDLMSMFSQHFDLIGDYPTTCQNRKIFKHKDTEKELQYVLRYIENEDEDEDNPYHFEYLTTIKVANEIFRCYWYKVTTVFPQEPHGDDEFWDNEIPVNEANLLYFDETSTAVSYFEWKKKILEFLK